MFLLPVSDDNPTARRPVVTQAILALNIGIWALGWWSGREVDWIRGYGFIPAEFSIIDLVASMFLHAGILHLAGNMLFFWIFGDNVEDRLGRGWFVFVYLASGAAGAVAHALAVSGTEGASTPCVGASGAISGVMAAYLVFYPHHRVKIVWSVFFLYWGAFSVRALWVIGFYAGQQILLVSIEGAEAGVAYWAHLGGFAAGLAVALVDRHSRGLPKELLPGARPEDVPFALSAPSEIPLAVVPAGYAVLRADDTLVDPAPLAKVVASVTGEPAADVARRLRRTRGLVARGLSSDRARALQAALAAAGDPSTFLVDERAAPALPPPRLATSAAAGAEGFVFEAGGTRVLVPWSRVAAVFASRVNRRAADLAGRGTLARATERFVEGTLVDVFVRNPPGRFRLVQARDRRGPVGGNLGASPEMRSFCEGILRHRGSVPVNNGVAVASGRGHWGYLHFPSEIDYEDYAWWLVQFIRKRSGASDPQA